MQLTGLAASTQEGYLNAVRGLARHYRRSPEELTEEDLRQYFLFLANEKNVARSTATVALCGIKFLYEQTLGRQWASLRLLRPPRRKKLPVILNREEVRRALAAVRISAYRACLTTIYACGLRANEGAHLRVEHIEACRTAYLGGHIKQCDRCGKKVYADHSCRNRNCPKCHGQQTEHWIRRRQARLLPSLHYLLTFTLPSPLRPVAQAHQHCGTGHLIILEILPPHPKVPP